MIVRLDELSRAGAQLPVGSCRWAIMPSPAHEVLVAALGDRPELLSLLVEKLCERRLPPIPRADSTVRFADPEEVRPDVVLRDGATKRWVMVEVQGDRDHDKARRWVLAAAALFDETGVLGDVVVITHRPRVARWAGRVARLRAPLGTRLVLQPVVLLIAGEAVERLLDEVHPELALLAAWAMQDRHGPRARRVIERALELTELLPEPLRAVQGRAIYNVLSERMHQVLEEMAMDLDKIPETKSAQSARLAMESVLQRAEARGEARGEAKGEARALLTLLDARGLVVSEDERARVLSCQDAATLEIWIRRAATVATAAEALD